MGKSTMHAGRCQGMTGVDLLLVVGGQDTIILLDYFKLEFKNLLITLPQLLNFVGVAYQSYYHNSSDRGIREGYKIFQILNKLY